MLVQLHYDANIAQVIIDRPEALNALNRETLLELQAVVDKIKNLDEVRVVLFRGGGEKSFVAGADIAQMVDLKPLNGTEFSRLGQDVFSAIADLPVPTIAVIQGFALGGGCELALACDIRLAGEKARFGQPEVGLGIVPGFGGTQRLPRLIGPGKAKKMILSGDMISAAQALAIGLVEEVVQPEQLMESALKLASCIAGKSPNAVRLAKLAINQGMEGSLDEGMKLEASLFGLCFASDEQREGMLSFLQKRPAKF